MEFIGRLPIHEIQYLLTLSLAEFKKHCKQCKNNEESKKQYSIMKSFCETNMKNDDATNRMHSYSEETQVYKGRRLYSGSSVQGFQRIFGDF
jgi:hypothetical protein